MYDFVIQRDGCLRLPGDVVGATYSTFLSQRLYQALMEMPANVISSARENDAASVEPLIRAHLQVYFTGDPDVNPTRIGIKINSVGSTGVSVSLSYNSASPDGRQEVLVDTGALVETAGVISSVDLNPYWLSLRNDPSLVTFRHYVTITEPTRKLEIPIEPASDESGVVYPISLQPYAYSGTPSVRTVNFSFSGLISRRKYYLNRYVSGVVPGLETVLSVSITSAPVGYAVLEENGEPVVVTSLPGLITGTAEVMTAIQATREYSVENPEAFEHVFPLRPVRGHYHAVFPKTVAAGSYVVQYTGQLEEV